MFSGLYNFPADHRDFNLHPGLKQGWKSLKISAKIKKIRQV